MWSVMLNMCVETDRHAFRSLQDRIRSFHGWRGSTNPQDLAEAGFYYIRGDITRCFYCGITIHNWKVDDIPLEEHLRWQNSCRFAQLIDNVQCLKGVLQDKKQSLEIERQRIQQTGSLPDEMALLQIDFLLLLLQYKFLL